MQTRLHDTDHFAERTGDSDVAPETYDRSGRCSGRTIHSTDALGNELYPAGASFDWVWPPRLPLSNHTYPYR